MIPWLILKIIDLYVLVIFVYIIMSWIPNNNATFNTVYEALGRICEPFLGLFRKIIPPVGGLDFSPIVAVIVLQLIARLVIGLLF
ncbi:MAG: YggT family protein [Coriobacteriales bacterium]|jgi:YggT family protein